MKTEIDERMTKARFALVMSQPFFGTLALHLELVEADIPTMATDGRKLWYSKKFLDELTEKEIQGVIAHETMHCAYRHMTRRQHRDPKLWNIAGDFAINTDLLAAGFTLPKTDCIDKNGRFKGMNSEKIYEALRQQQQQQPPPPPPPPPPPSDEDGDGAEGQGDDESDDDADQEAGDQSGEGDDGEPGDDKPGEGSGDGEGEGGDEAQDNGAGKPFECPDPGMCGGVMDGASESDPVENDKLDKEWEINVRQAMNVAAAGTLPGALQAIAKQIAHRAIDWREVLCRFIDDATTRDYRWTRPNKRMLGIGYTLPSLVRESIAHVGMVIDTSGSIFDEVTFGKFCTEAQAALDEGRIEKITVIQCDVRVTCINEFYSGDIIELNIDGGGGTRFSPAFQWFEDEAPDVSAIIYFTDLYCSDFAVEPACPVLWAVHGPDQEYRPKVLPFGERVDLVG